MKGKLKHIVRFVPLLIFVAYYTSVNFFAHTHIINNVVIVHSHPFPAGENHQHSATSLQFISAISNFVSYALFFGLLVGGVAVFANLLFASRKYSKYFINVRFYSFLRPPPIVA